MKKLASGILKLQEDRGAKLTTLNSVSDLQDPQTPVGNQLAEIAGLRQWRIGQVEIAKRLGVNQATISRGLERAERLGVRPARIRGEQQSMIDYFGGGEAA